MEDGITEIKPGSNIKMADLKHGDGGVLKTTTTEVRFDNAEDVDSIGGGVRRNGLRRSSSSDIYIIDHARDKV